MKGCPELKHFVHIAFFKQRDLEGDICRTQLENTMITALEGGVRQFGELGTVLVCFRKREHGRPLHEWNFKLCQVVVDTK